MFINNMHVVTNKMDKMDTIDYFLEELQENCIHAGVCINPIYLHQLMHGICLDNYDGVLYITDIIRSISSSDIFCMKYRLFGECNNELFIQKIKDIAQNYNIEINHNGSDTLMAFVE